MTAFFCDSSVVIKRHVVELGSDWVRMIASPDRVNQLIVSRLAQIEVVSGIARLRREGRLSYAGAIAARRLLDRHMLQEYSVVELNATIVRRAQDLLLTHPLRAYDAVQLASALDYADRLTGVGLAPLVFVSADRRLLAGAEAEGLATDDPNAH